MHLTVLLDNHSDKEKFETEHGLSFYIETGYSKILFDTGQSEAFIHNALKMGVDISAVDYLVLSHGHYDHTGGIEHFLKYNHQAKILIRPEALLPKYHGKKYIGVYLSLKIPEKRIIQLNDNFTIDPVTEVTGNIQVGHPEDVHYEDFFIKAQEGILPDTFRDEVFLTLKADGKVTIITGCSHNGILNIIETARQHFTEPVGGIFGGFHLKDSNEQTVKKTAEFLNAINIERIVTGHCTGMENFLILRRYCKTQVSYSFTGNTFKL